MQGTIEEYFSCETTIGSDEENIVVCGYKDGIIELHNHVNRRQECTGEHLKKVINSSQRNEEDTAEVDLLENVDDINLGNGVEMDYDGMAL